MREFDRQSMIRVAAGVAAGAVIFACTNTVYKDFPGFAPPPSAAGEFLGYSTTSSKLTVCGNCHTSHQALWATAKHASAWADLQNSGHAASSCNNCHTVSTLGNFSTSDSAGYAFTHDVRYQDVQCESCHGAGQAHVNAPEVAGTQPVPSIVVAVGTKTSCSGCHTGNHEPFVEEWSQSAHGIVPHFSNGAGNTACQPCHTGQGALATTMGVSSDYLEMNNPLGTQGPNAALTIVCAVCHDPHGSPNQGQLRFPVDTLAVGSNLCARCHNRRSVPDTTSSSGPHAPQGPLVIGNNDVGWRPPNMDQDARIFGSHGDTTLNKRLCATCHVFQSQSTDSSGITFYSTGHLFLAAPCTDANGKPQPGDCDETQRNFTACATSGCHASGDVAKNLLDTKVATISALLAELQALLNDTNKIPCSTYNVGAVPFNSARGARFNYLLAAQPASTNDAVCGKTRNLPPPVADPGSTTHNVPLIEQLLLNSIQQVQHDYP
ncbi:MAG TPA: cytochrome c3 family protein [Gemmatimonadaceae bacterium]|nr:cytochrome c3 family protein [Gemmatimonadaceae bacterium]